MVRGKSYKLRMNGEQDDGLSPPPPPPPPPSGHGPYQQRGGKRGFKCTHCLHYGLPSPTTQVSPDSPPPLPPSGHGPYQRRGKATTQSVSGIEVLLLLPPPPPPPPPPAMAEHADEIPVDISSEDEDEKPNINDPLSGLMPPPPVRQNASTVFLDETQVLIARVKSHLASELLTLPESEIKSMICLANQAFTLLDCCGDGYLSFYLTVRRFIEFSQERLVADALRNEHCTVFEGVKNRYKELVIEAKDAKEALSSANMTLDEAEKKLVGGRKRVENLRSLLIRCEMELKQDEAKAVAKKSDFDRFSEIHSSIEVEVQRVWLEDKEAKKLFDEAKKRCEEASEGIALVKEELRSLVTPSIHPGNSIVRNLTWK